jgi:methyl-accepting chemotaxis protein
MRKFPYPHVRRRSKLVNPRLQGGAAIRIAVIVLGVGTLIGFLLLRDIRQALWDASSSGHFAFATPFRVVEGILARWLVVLFALVFAGGSLAFIWHVRGIRRGISRLVEVLEASAMGDLSSPVGVPSPGGIVDFEREIDNIRSYTLGLIDEVRGEVKALRTSVLSEEEFARKWEDLKEKIGRIIR